MDEPLFCDYIWGIKYLKSYTEKLYDSDDRPLPRLVSPYRTSVFWHPRHDTPESCGDGWMRASSRHHLYRELLENVLPVPEGDLPDESGLWAYHTLEDIYESEPAVRRSYTTPPEELRRYREKYTYVSSGYTDVMAVVIAKGTIDTYDNCFKAEYMRVMALVLGGETGMEEMVRYSMDLDADLIELSGIEEYASQWTNLKGFRG